MRQSDAAHMETFLKIRTMLEKNHADAGREIKLFQDVRNMLVKKFTGKRVDTKRTITYIKAERPTWVVNFYSVGNSLYIRVWGGDSGYRDHNDYWRVCLNRCRDIGYFDAAEFDADNSYMSNTVKEQERREALLADVGQMRFLAAEVDNFNETRERVMTILGQSVDHYDLKKLVKE